MFRKHYYLFAASLAISTIVAAPVVTDAKEITNDEPVYTLNSLHNDEWKNKLDIEIYDWLYENGITSSRDIDGPWQIGFYYSSFAKMLSVVRAMPLPEDKYYTTDKFGFYSAYTWEIRELYKRLNYEAPKDWLTYQDLAVLLPEIFTQYKGLSPQEMYTEIGILKNGVYNPTDKIYQYTAGKVIYHAVHTSKHPVPTKSKHVSSLKYIPLKNIETVTTNPKLGPLPTLTFIDVSKKSSHYEAIQKMQQRNIINGYPDNTFRPKENITRQHAAAMFLRYSDMMAPYKTKTVPYADLDESSTYYDAIVELQRRNIVKVDQNQNINPTKPMTRAEVATAIVNLLDLKPVYKKGDFSFSDIEKSPYHSYIEAAVQAGIINGYPDGTFRTKEPISRQHFATMMARAIDYKENNMMKMHKNTELHHYSPYELPDFDKQVDLGMPREQFEQQQKEALDALKHEVIANGSGSSNLLYNKNFTIEEAILDRFKYTDLTKEQTIQAFNYIYYTGKPLVINNYVYQYNPRTEMLMYVNGFNSIN